MWSVAKEDLIALKKKHPRLIFVIGPHGSGKASQCQKIVNEYKYSLIKMNDLIHHEIGNGTKQGHKANSYVARGESLPSDLAVNILVKGIVEAKEDSILIEGFPRSLDQAIEFEMHIIPIKLVLCFTASEETCLHRISEMHKKQGNEIDLESIKQRNQKSELGRNHVINFYSKYGIVRIIDSEKSIGEVNNNVKQSLYPVIYSIIGKRYSGKTELSKVIKSKVGLTLIDFEEFSKRPEINKRAKDTDYVVNAFIASLRKMEDCRVLIENFPQNKEQYSYFVNNCKELETIHYLNADNSVCLERLNGISINDCNYTNCSQLTQMLHDFEGKKDFIEFLRKKAKFLEINVNNHKVLTIDNLMENIQPYCVIIKTDQALKESKRTLTDMLINDYKYEVIDCEMEIQNSKMRKIPLVAPEVISPEVKIQLIRKILFDEKNTKYILDNFPNDLMDLNEFESKLCKINKMIYISDVDKFEDFTDDSIEVYFKNKNKLILLQSKNINPYQIEESLDLTRDINIVYGFPMSGKSTIAKHLQMKYNYTMLDFKELIEVIKKTKIDPENPEAEPEITFPDLVKGLQDYLKHEPLSKRVIVDNFFIPNAAEPFLIDTYEKADQIINTLGRFRNFYEITCEENTLINRYKLKEGITEELSEDQKAAFLETQDKPKLLIETIRSLANNCIKVNTDGIETKSKALFDTLYGRNFIIVKHEYNINIEKKLELFSSQNRLMYINVPKLIYSHCYLNDAYAKRLEDNYGKKLMKKECQDESKWDEFVYYKYNPLHFDISLVNEIILKYANENYREIEYSGNYIILTGYLNYDLLNEQELTFNLPIHELKQVMELGDLTAFIQITNENIKDIEDEEAIELIIEKPKKAVTKQQDEDGEGEQEEAQEEEPQEEENPDEPPKFKPEGLKWTNYDGVPRNYVQVLKRLKLFPIKQVDSNQENASNELISLLNEHLENYKKRSENEYKGAIGIIKL